jgi:hypothetical protein
VKVKPTLDEHSGVRNTQKSLNNNGLLVVADMKNLKMFENFFTKLKFWLLFLTILIKHGSACQNVLLYRLLDILIYDFIKGAEFLDELQGHCILRKDAGMRNK